MPKKILHALPARFFHWANLVFTAILMVTGFYIHDPQWFSFLGSMDVARKLHFVTMYLLLCGLIYRSGYSVISGDMKELMFGPKDIKGFWPLMKYYLFITNQLDYWGKYNSGQKLLYSLWPIVVILQGITGFMLYRPAGMATWIVVLGGDIQIRVIHYYATWFFVCSVALHVYLALLSGTAMIKSMIIGYNPKDFH